MQLELAGDKKDSEKVYIQSSQRNLSIIKQPNEKNNLIWNVNYSKNFHKRQLRIDNFQLKQENNE